MKILVGFILGLFLLNWWLTNPTITVGPENYEFSYLVKYAGNTSSDESLPMLVALHGNGDSPGNFYKTALDKISAPARIIVLKGVIKHGSGSAWPWSQDQYDQYGSLITQAISELADTYPTKGKPILLGFSGGGMFAYHSALHFGDKYSYILPISGNLRSSITSDLNIGARVMAYHGTKDDVVSFGGGASAAKVLKEKGVNVSFKQFDGGHHGMFRGMKSEISAEVDKKLLEISFQG